MRTCKGKKTKTTIQNGFPIGASVCLDMTARENGHAAFYSICYRIISFLFHPFSYYQASQLLCLYSSKSPTYCFPSPAKHCGQQSAVNSVCSMAQSVFVCFLFFPSHLFPQPSLVQTVLLGRHTRNTKGKSQGPVSDTRGKKCDNRDYTAVLAGFRTPRRIDTQSHVKSAPTFAGEPNVNNRSRATVRHEGIFSIGRMGFSGVQAVSSHKDSNANPVWATVGLQAMQNNDASFKGVVSMFQTKVCVSIVPSTFECVHSIAWKVCACIQFPVKQKTIAETSKCLLIN